MKITLPIFSDDRCSRSSAIILFFPSHFQNYENRNHVNVYLKVCVYEGTVGEGIGAKNRKTEVVVSISNYHFNRDAQKNPEIVECRASDCKIGIKYSSTEFKGPNAKPNQEYYFDKLGVLMSYAAFAELLSQTYFVDTFMPATLANYSAAINPRGKEPTVVVQSRADQQSTSLAVKKNSKERKKTTGTKRARFPDDEEEASGADDDDEPEDQEVEEIRLEEGPSGVASKIGKAARRGKNV